MFKTSHLQELKRRYAQIYAPPSAPEAGTDGVVKNYKKVTPGQGEEVEEHCGVCGEHGVEEDTDKDEPGTQGDQAEYQKKRKEIAAKFGVKSCSELEGEKKKACYAALDAAHVSDDEEDEDDDPVGKNEEVEIEEHPGFAAAMQIIDKKKKEKEKKNKKEEVEVDETAPELETPSSKKALKKVQTQRKIQKTRLAIRRDRHDDIAGRMPKKGVDEEKDNITLWKDGNLKFVITKRDTKGMRGKQDPFSMHVVDKKGKKVKDWGTHPSLAGAKKFAQGRGFKEEIEIEEGTALQVRMALDDVGITKVKWKNETVYVMKKDVEKAKKALEGNVKYKGKTPKVSGGLGGGRYVESVEIEEGTALQVRMALDDVGLKGTWKNEKVYVKKSDVEKAKKALKGNVIYRGRPPIVVGEGVEIEEGGIGAIPLKQLKKQYDRNEDANKHTENYLMLARAFGTPAEVKKIKEIMKRNEKQGSTSSRDNDWMYKNINPYYKKLTQKEEVEIDEKRKSAKDVGMECQECGKRFRSKNPKYGVTKCPKCKSTDIDVSFGEEVEIDEAPNYQLYHKDFSSAMQHAYAHAKKKGFTVDPEEIDSKVATGPKKPSKGKTNRYILGTDKRKKVHIQVANLDNKRYELNMYIESNGLLNKVKGALSRIRSLVEKPEEIEEVESPNADAIAKWKAKGGVVKKPTPDLKKIDKAKSSFLKAYQGMKQKDTPKKSQSSSRKQRYVQKPTQKKVEVRAKETPAEIMQHYTLPDYIVHNDIKKFPRMLMGGINKIIPGVKFQKHVINHQTFGKIPGLGIFLPGDSDPKLMIQWNQRVHDPNIEYIWADPKYAEKGTDPSTFRKNDMIVWINEAATNNPALKGKVDWYQRKEFEGATPEDASKRTLQYLKTKVKRMAKEEIQQEASEGKKKRDHEYELKWGRKKDTKSVHDKHNEEIQQEVGEKIDVDKANMGDVIKDFQNSDAPQFKGKSDKKRREMAIAAKLSREQDETDEPKSKKKDKINLKPKVDEKMKKYSDLINKLREKRDQNEDADADMKAAREKKERERKRSAISHQPKPVVKEAVTDQGIEYEEQDWDGPHRLEQMAPNLHQNYAKYMEEELEGPYTVHGEVYFYDRKVGMFYSVSGEDYVDEETAKDLVYSLHRDGNYKVEFPR